MKRDPDLCTIPVIMLSITDDRRLARTMGAVDFLSKPIDQQTLLSTIRKHIDESENPTLLIVEDDVATRQIIPRGVHGLSCEIAEAENGRDALDILEQTQPDLIVLDLMMPELDGFQFLQRTRVPCFHR